MSIVLDVISQLLVIVWWIIMIQVVLSWLIAFNVINTQNQFVRQFLYALSRVTEPIYRPIRRVLPDFGGLDFAPLIVLLIIGLLQREIAHLSLMYMVSE